MADRNLTCKDCGKPFVFTERDQQFYAEKLFSDPKRCVPCRRKKKAAMAQRLKSEGGNYAKPENYK
jgi:hypothetical protein